MLIYSWSLSHFPPIFRYPSIFLLAFCLALKKHFEVLLFRNAFRPFSFVGATNLFDSSLKLLISSTFSRICFILVWTIIIWFLKSGSISYIEDFRRPFFFCCFFSSSVSSSIDIVMLFFSAIYLKIKGVFLK